MSENPPIFSLRPGKVVTDEMLNLFMRRFNAQFPTEKDCLEELYRRAEAKRIFRCRYCKSEELEKRYGDRVGKCLRCNKKNLVNWRHVLQSY